MGKGKKYILLAMLLFWGTGLGFAQKAESHLFTNIAEQANLPHHAVHHIMEDSFGFIWISTRNGLCRYDGAQCTLFGEREKGTNQLNSSMVWLTYEDSKNRVWIGTKGGGLSMYNPMENRTRHFLHEPDNPASLSHNIVTAIFEDSQNRLWIGTDGGGLNQLIEGSEDSVTFRNIAWDNDISQLSVLDIIEDEQTGKLWLATFGEGILIYDTRRNTIRQIHTGTKENPLSDDYVMSLAKQGNTVWAGTKFGGLNKIDLQTQKIMSLRYNESNPRSIPHDFVWDLYVENENRLWVATYGGGFGYLNEAQEFVRVEDIRENGFSDSYIMQVTRGSQAQYWVATDHEGGFHFNPQMIYKPFDFSWELVDNFSNLIINHFYKDRSGRYWLLTNQGLYRLNRKQMKASRQPVGFGTSMFYKMAEDSEGRLWIASNYNLHFIHPETGETGTVDTHNRLEATGTDRLFDVLIDDEGALWLASDGGLIRYEPALDKLQLFRHHPGDPATIAGNKIDHLFREGKFIWVSTDDRGVSRFNTQTEKAQKLDFRKYDKTLPAYKTINKIEKDQDGNLWLGSSEHGLFIIHRSGVVVDSVSHLQSGKGLISNQIYDIELSGQGALVGSDKGLSWVEPDSVIKNIRFPPEISRMASIRFARPDSLFLYSRNQVVQLRQHQLRKPVKTPPIQITGIDVYGEPVFTLKDFLRPNPIVLEHSQNFLTLHYRVLNYNPSAYYGTQYMLEGHDPYWLDGRDTEAVNYTNLSPGNYTFRLRFINHRQQQKAWAVPIIVKAPFWQQGWFRVLVLVCITGLLYGGYRYRMYYLLKEERIRNRLARDLHDDLSATLSSISFFSEAAQKVQLKDEEATARFLKLIEEGAVESKEKINDIIWAIDPENDDWSVFLKKCKRYAADMLDSKEIKYQIEIDDDFSMPVSLEIRQNFWLIYKEMVNNLLKHSEATKAEIRFTETKGHIFLKVSDNGTGISESKAEVGHGVKNIYDRARQIGATAELISGKGVGTTWKVTLSP